MPTDLERQLPRFAEALDRDAPAISVDEIFSRGAVALDVDLAEWPSRGQVEGVAVTSWVDATTSHSGNGERDASIEFVSTAAEAPVHRRLGLKVAMAAAAAAVLVVALASIVQLRDEPGPADVPPPTLPALPPTTQVDPFVGVWLSTDTDGSSQTMNITRSGTDEYEVVIHDEAATVACAGGASTMAGAGRAATGTSLVIAQPELTCDDGTTSPLGPAPQAELADFTLELNSETDQFVDIYGVAWQRANPAVAEVEAAPAETEAPAGEAADVGPCVLLSADTIVLDVTNNSSKQSSYTIEVDWLNDAGKEIGGELFNLNDLRPGERAVEEHPVERRHSGRSCEIAEVRRLESDSPDDVTEVTCTVAGVDVLGDIATSFVATNNSSQLWEYGITAAIIRDGVRVGTARAIINVPPGESAPGDGFSSRVNGPPEGVTCETVNVERFDSSS